MTARTSPRGRRRYLAAVPALALAATGLTMGSSSVVAAPSSGSPSAGADSASSEGYINYVAPRMEAVSSGDKALKINGKAVSKKTAQAQQDALAKARAVDRKHA